MDPKDDPIYKMAEVAVITARTVLGPNATEQAIEDYAVELMQTRMLAAEEVN